MEIPKPHTEHQWLQQLVGEWRFESECEAGPGEQPMKSTGTESVRSLGTLWTIGAGKGEMQGGGEAETLMTLGFVPELNKFVGTFIVSVMTHLWPYNGSLDETGKALVLDSEGPSFTEPGKTAKYQDVITIIDDNHRTLTSRFLTENGEWHQFMTAHYYRVH